MYHSRLYSAITIGLDVIFIEVEVVIEPTGFPAFNIVGLADKSVDEAKERVRASIKSCGFKFPDRRITINLAPADVQKKGTIFDLAMALGILAASRQIKATFGKTLFLGELSLDGRLKAVNGVLPVLLKSRNAFESVIISEENINEASLVKALSVYAGLNLNDVVLHFTKVKNLKKVESVNLATMLNSDFNQETDFKDIYGQSFAKRALEVSAAGGHSISMIGPPGVGKTMLSRAFSSILPNLSEEECLEITRIYSVAGLLKSKDIKLITKRPFRSPHHTVSLAGLIGGGNPPIPGEVSLAHFGVLYIDEFNFLAKQTLEALRQPLEEKVVVISRFGRTMVFPCKFIFLASYNPCACGYLGDKVQKCICSPYEILNYKKKVSGPILDRMDMFAEVNRAQSQEIETGQKLEPSSEIKSRVAVARKIQRDRYSDSSLQIYCNADLRGPALKKFCELDVQCSAFIRRAMDKFNLSFRAYERVIKVGRTIADLSGEKNIRIEHLAEALQFRIKN